MLSTWPLSGLRCRLAIHVVLPSISPHPRTVGERLLFHELPFDACFGKSCLLHAGEGSRGFATTEGAAAVASKTPTGMTMILTFA